MAAPRLITTREVWRLIGLTSNQLREWASGRYRIHPDLLPYGPGTRTRAFNDDANVLCLDYHLNVLSDEFDMMPLPIQRTFFPATRVL